MKKYNYIDLAKTIAMFLVILFHSLLFFTDNPHWLFTADYRNDTATFLSNILNCTVVPLFVFCSGFLFQLSTQKREMSTGANILKRAKRLLLPYFLYRIFWLVPTYSIFDIPAYGRPKGSSLIYSYKSMLIGQFNDVSWFLAMLFWVSIIWIILRKFLKKERIIIGAIVAIALYFITHQLLAEMNYYALNEIDIYIVIFFVGASFFWITDKIYERSIPVLLLISIPGILICAILAQYASLNYWLYSVVAIIMPVVMIIFTMGLCKCAFMGKIGNTRIYKWLLKHNMDIYLMQAPGMYLSFMMVYPAVGWNCFLCVVICYIVTIAIDFVIVWLLTCVRSVLMGMRKTRKVE